MFPHSLAGQARLSTPRILPAPATRESKRNSRTTAAQPLPLRYPASHKVPIDMPRPRARKKRTGKKEFLALPRKAKLMLARPHPLHAPETEILLLTPVSAAAASKSEFRSPDRK